MGCFEQYSQCALEEGAGLNTGASEFMWTMNFSSELLVPESSVNGVGFLSLVFNNF